MTNGEESMDEASSSSSSSNNENNDDDYQAQEFGTSFIGGDPCGSKYNTDPHDAKVTKPGMPDSMKERIQKLADARTKRIQQEQQEAAAAAAESDKLTDLAYEEKPVNVMSLDGSGDEQVQMSTVKIDDGGSDLTDRFKYKVQALMGSFDPLGEDTERQDGNILNAMLTFPVQYSFNVVGKTRGDDALRDTFVQQVKEALMSVAGDEVEFEVTVTKRGNNFTKVTLRAEMQSAAMIASTYESLKALELTAMAFW